MEATAVNRSTLPKGTNLERTEDERAEDERPRIRSAGDERQDRLESRRAAAALTATGAHSAAPSPAQGLPAPTARSDSAAGITLRDIKTRYGKGVSHNPNADSSSYLLTLETKRLGTVEVGTGEVFGPIRIGPDSRYESGVSNHSGARPFKFVQAGKVFELERGRVFGRVSGGASLNIRTADATQVALSPYWAAAVGARFGQVDVALFYSEIVNPGLNDPWTKQRYDKLSILGIEAAYRFK